MVRMMVSASIVLALAIAAGPARASDFYENFLAAACVPVASEGSSPREVL